MKIPNPNWAWIAGIYEGEGCISSRSHVRKDGTRAPRLTVVMADEDVITRLYNITGVGTVSGPYNYTGGKPQFKWHISELDDIEYIISQIWEWLGERRKQQIVNVFNRAGIKSKNENTSK